MGRCLTLECVGSGNPPPVISWTKNNIELRRSHDVDISANGTQLTMCPVEASDAGTYMCIVTNKVGGTNVSATLDVIGIVNSMHPNATTFY